MNNIKYKKMVEELTPKENRLVNMLVAFIVGGLVGVLGTIIFVNLNKIYDEETSISFMLLILIILSSFFSFF